ncbi:hypothetical protein Tco_0850653, partial [Tanacetum coccineum]
ESLVIQQVWSVATFKCIDDDLGRQNNIFRTNCTSKVKVCNMMIDGGSCENVVSTYMVDKFALKNVNHPEPYQLTWLKKGKIVKVSKRIFNIDDFVPGSSILNKPAYHMNPKEYEQLQCQVIELLEKSLIKESISPHVVSALLVPKHGGAFRMCVDSRAVNKIMIKYRFPIPHFNDLLD